jgi:predicted transcriptional regulator of viral defense system
MNEKLKKLAAQYPLFNLATADLHGVSRQLIQNYLKKGLIKRISTGVYQFIEYQEEQGIVAEVKEILLACPQCVVGLKTALKIYDLTDEIVGEMDLLVPNNNVPKRKMKLVRFYTTRPDLMRLGVVQMQGISITTLERTIVDLLRIGESISYLLQIIKLAHQKKMDIDLKKIKKFGEKFRVKKKVLNLFEAYL